MITWLEKVSLISKYAIKMLGMFQLPLYSVILFEIDDVLIDKTGVCIFPMVLLFHYSLMLGIKPIIVTSRIDDNYTENQLSSLGLSKYFHIYFRNEESTAQFKLKVRHKLFKKGYVTLMSVGNEQHDIGEYGGISILLPKIESSLTSSQFIKLNYPPLNPHA